MQDASAAFDATMAGAVVWTDPTVQVDWDGDGFGAAGSIDDLSPLVGSPTVSHFVDDGLPDEVSFVSDTEAATATMALVGGRDGRNAVQYFSPFQTASPLADYDRDVAPVTVDLGAVTADGQESVRVFTGQMADTPVQGRTVTLEAVSATRMRLGKLVQPAVRTTSEDGLLYGLTASWPVVWALHQCGVHPSPPPQEGTRLWVPLHGSGQPFLPDGNTLLTNRSGFLWCQSRRSSDTESQIDEPPTWIDGPYVGGFGAINTSDHYQRLIGTLTSSEDFAPGDDWLSQAGSVGRVQFYVRGDPVEIDDVPGGVTDWQIEIAPPPDSLAQQMLAGLALINLFGDSGIVVGVDTNRHVFIDFRQSSTRRIYHKTAPIVLTDNFSRTTANGWGTADTGQTYSTSVGGAAADRSTTTAPFGHAEIDTNTASTDYVMATSIGSVDQEASATLRVSALPATSSLQIGMVARFTDSANFYRGEMQIATSGAITARIQKRVLNVTSVVSSASTGFTYVAATPYRLRFQVIGTTLRLKIWPEAVVEPSAWNVEVYDDTSLTTGSLGGAYCRNDTAVTTHVFSFDVFEIRDLASGQVPTDGEWHFIGCAWDIANNGLWVRLGDDLTPLVPSPAMSTASLAATNVADDYSGTGWAGMPMAELQFATGPAANPDNTPLWIHDADYWTQTAIVTRSVLDLEVVAIDQPREAWELIGAYAASEFASRRTDEFDRFLYLTMLHWVDGAQQTVAVALSTDTNAAAPTVAVDWVKVRNAVRVEYPQTRVDTILSPVVIVNTPIVVPPGVTQVVLGTSEIATRLYGNRLYVVSADQVFGIDESLPSPSYVVFNTAIDGTGTYADPGPFSRGVLVFGTVVDWSAGQVLIEFTNLTATTYYTVHNGPSTVELDYLQVSAYAARIVSASETVYNTASIDARGERSLPVSLSQVQSQAAALQAAAVLLGEVAYPVPVVTGLSLFADPRRQPGDLVTFDDADQSGASGLWRLRQVKHVVFGADYRQTVTLRRARTVGLWDEGLWDDCVWGL